jgi:hypothetical protein
MKYTILISIILASVGCATSDIKPNDAKDTLFVSKNNFLEFPFYKEIDELYSVPNGGKCTTEECNEFVASDKLYYKAVLLNGNNYTDYLIGVWSGGDCITDQWSMNTSGNFSSHYPLDGGIYEWSGKYSFKDKTYIEDGADSKGDKEWNEAHLYYVPATELLIYKGTKSFDSFNTDGSIKYIYYTGPDFYYFRRCDKP